LLAARNSMRVWRGPHLRYDQGRPLATVNLPSLPAALPLYSKVRRTTVLGLDFDTTTFGPSRVRADVADAVTLISRAGGRVIVDRSPTGGMHVWVPLWSQADLRAPMLRPLLDAIRRRWRTLDITPMTNPRTGCLTGPGSPCIGGGHRTLITPLDEAIAAATDRSPAGTLGRLATLLNAAADDRDAAACSTHNAARAALAGAEAPPAASRQITAEAGAAMDRAGQLRSAVAADRRAYEAESRRHLPGPRTPELPPPHARDFVLTGRIAAHRPQWTRSEARMSVLSCAVRAGWSLDDVRQRVRSGLWQGMADAYAKYGTAADRYLTCEWHRASAWASALPVVRVSPHEQQHTGGAAARWLAQARRWAARTPGLPRQIRTTAVAVLDALASAARRTRSMRLAVGGRWLSIGAGLLNEQTVWAVLRCLREVEGAPIQWGAAHVGRRADVYELVPPHLDGRQVEVTRDEIAAAGTNGVAPVWKVIGHRARNAFELIDQLSRARPDGRIPTRELLQQSAASRTALYEAIGLLQRWRLVTRGHGWVARTNVTLAEIADAHGVSAMVAERVQRHRAERRAWWALLALWEADTAVDCPPSEHLPPDPMPAYERQQWLESVMATGPPACPDGASATEAAQPSVVDLLVDALGAVPLPVAATW